MEEDIEEIQVLVVRGNRLYLPREVREAFDLHNGDKVLVFDSGGQILMKVIGRPKHSRKE